MLGWLDGDVEVKGLALGIDDGTPVEVGLVLGWYWSMWRLSFEEFRIEA